MPAPSAIGNASKNTLLAETAASSNGLACGVSKELSLDGPFGPIMSREQLAAVGPERAFVAGRHEPGSPRTRNASPASTENAARANAVRFPTLIARVRLDEGCGFIIARTYAKVDEHYTVWGDPYELLARVEQPVRRFDEEPSWTRRIGAPA